MHDLPYSNNLTLLEALGFSKTSKSNDWTLAAKHALCVLFEETDINSLKFIDIQYANFILNTYAFFQALHEEVITPQEGKQLCEKFNGMEIKRSVFTNEGYTALKYKLITVEDLMKFEVTPYVYITLPKFINEKLNGKIIDSSIMKPLQLRSGSIEDFIELTVKFWEQFNYQFLSHPQNTPQLI